MEKIHIFELNYSRSVEFLDISNSDPKKDIIKISRLDFMVSLQETGVIFVEGLN